MTNNFLLSSTPIVFLDENATDKYSMSNLKQSQNHTIITKTNPSILLSFYEEVKEDKNMFESSLPFEVHFVKTSQYKDNKEIFVENKKQLLLSFTGNIDKSFQLKLLLSKISSTNDQELHFSTKNENEILNYSTINYKKACITLKNDI
jgi:hypothetical protein